MTGVRESEIDGVLCFWVDMGRPASCAHLMFRQGLADEPLHETGWLHLLEHLALLDRETLTRPIEGRLTLLLTHFAAFGGPEALIEQLGALARWLAEPDLRLLARERGVLQAAGPEPRDPLIRSLTWRYGASGPGVTSYAEVGAVRATDQLLVERSRRVFNASNAILVLDGPPPEGLRLPLPAASTSTAPTAEPVGRALPAAYRDEVGLTLSGVVTRTHEAGFLPGVLERAAARRATTPQRRRLRAVVAHWPRSTTSTRWSRLGPRSSPRCCRRSAEAALEVTAPARRERRTARVGAGGRRPRLRVLESPAAMVETRSGGGVRRAERPGADVLRGAPRRSCGRPTPAQVDRAAHELHASLLVGLPEAAPLHRALPLVDLPRVAADGSGDKHSHVNWPADLTTFSVDEHVAERLTGSLCRPCRSGRRRRRPRLARRRPSPGRPPRATSWRWSRASGRGGKELTKALDAAIPAELHVAMPDRTVTFQRMSVDRARRLGLRPRGEHPGRPVLAARRGDAPGAVGAHRRSPSSAWSSCCWPLRSGPSCGAPEVVQRTDCVGTPPSPP